MPTELVARRQAGGGLAGGPGPLNEVAGPGPEPRTAIIIARLQVTTLVSDCGPRAAAGFTFQPPPYCLLEKYEYKYYRKWPGPTLSFVHLLSLEGISHQCLVV